MARENVRAEWQKFGAAGAARQNQKQRVLSWSFTRVESVTDEEVTFHRIPADRPIFGDDRVIDFLRGGQSHRDE